MIYHFIAFIQLLLFVTLNAWIILLLFFVRVFLQEYRDVTTLSIKFLLYIAPIIGWIFIWFAYGWLWETRWWPSRDRLIRLLPPSMANTTVIKCQ